MDDTRNSSITSHAQRFFDLDLECTLAFRLPSATPCYTLLHGPIPLAPTEPIPVRKSIDTIQHPAYSNDPLTTIRFTIM